MGGNCGLALPEHILVGQQLGIGTNRQRMSSMGGIASSASQPASHHYCPCRCPLWHLAQDQPPCTCRKGGNAAFGIRPTTQPTAQVLWVSTPVWQHVNGCHRFVGTISLGVNAGLTIQQLVLGCHSTLWHKPSMGVNCRLVKQHNSCMGDNQDVAQNIKPTPLPVHVTAQQPCCLPPLPASSAPRTSRPPPVSRRTDRLPPCPQPGPSPPSHGRQ